MKLFKHIIPVIGLLGLFSCKQATPHYPEKRGLTDAKGFPNDSLAFYFSPIQPIDSGQLQFIKDSFWQNYFSATLYAFKEPVLYNAYLGKEQYRFLWLRSFHLPIVFTISNDHSNIMLTVKQLDRRPRFSERYSDMAPDEEAASRAIGYQIIKDTVTLQNGKVEVFTKVKADRRADIIYDSTKTLSQEDWNHFKELLDNANFWTLLPWQWGGAADGAVWMFEANTKQGYKYVGRQSPGGKIKDIGVFLINLSGLKEEIY
jgi:hypothetical protein